jgi:hypothetical protein
VAGAEHLVRRDQGAGALENAVGDLRNRWVLPLIGVVAADDGAGRGGGGAEQQIAGVPP